MGPPPRHPSELMEELLEEVLLRFPPEDPARLVRAALVCKCWCRVISGARFRRRFREFHGRAPILRFFCNLCTKKFVPMSPTCPPLIWDPQNFSIMDARHGRVLLSSGLREGVLVAWNPITGEQGELPLLPELHNFDAAAVLCAASFTGACDHLDFHGGPFLVVLVGIINGETYARVYSSESGAWSEPTYIQQPYDYIGAQPRVLVGNAVYFIMSVINWNICILKYNLGTHELNIIDPPPDCNNVSIRLMSTENGGLGCAVVKHFKLYLCSINNGLDEGVGWVQSKVIELKTVLPAVAHSHSPRVIGFAEGVGIIFLLTSDGIFSIDPKSVRVTKLCEEKHVTNIFPYMSFCTPELECSAAAEESRTGPSSSA